MSRLKSQMQTALGARSRAQQHVHVAILRARQHGVVTISIKVQHAETLISRARQCARVSSVRQWRRCVLVDAPARKRRASFWNSAESSHQTLSKHQLAFCASEAKREGVRRRVQRRAHSMCLHIGDGRQRRHRPRSGGESDSLVHSKCTVIGELGCVAQGLRFFECGSSWPSRSGARGADRVDDRARNDECRAANLLGSARVGEEEEAADDDNDEAAERVEHGERERLDPRARRRRRHVLDHEAAAREELAREGGDGGVARGEDASRDGEEAEAERALQELHLHVVQATLRQAVGEALHDAKKSHGQHGGASAQGAAAALGRGGEGESGNHGKQASALRQGWWCEEQCADQCGNEGRGGTDSLAQTQR
eukprot:6184039-Pleurochrysis_carterae.AAC.2